MKWKKKIKIETSNALYLQINAGDFLIPPHSMPHLRQTMSVVHDWYDLNISWCTSENQQGLGCCLAALLNGVCSFWSKTATGIGCTHRLTFPTAQIRNCWNADSVCLQCDTERSTPNMQAPCRIYGLCQDVCLFRGSLPSESQGRSLIESPVLLYHLTQISPLCWNTM